MPGTDLLLPRSEYLGQRRSDAEMRTGWRYRREMDGLPPGSTASGGFFGMSVVWTRVSSSADTYWVRPVVHVLHWYRTLIVPLENGLLEGKLLIVPRDNGACQPLNAHSYW